MLSLGYSQKPAFEVISTVVVSIFLLFVVLLHIMVMNMLLIVLFYDKVCSVYNQLHLCRECSI
jgi:hypothetical protein